MKPLTGWDRQCGFSEGQDVIRARRQEETAALAPLSASPVFLDLWDHQYRNPKFVYNDEADRALIDRGADELETALLKLPTRTWLMPLGIQHPDHKLCRRICLRVVDRQAEATWMIYEELAYYRLSRRRRWSARIAVSSALMANGFWARPQALPHTYYAMATKIEAMRCYVSQMKRLSEDFVRMASEGPESYLQLRTPSAGLQRVLRPLHKSDRRRLARPPAPV